MGTPEEQTPPKPSKAMSSAQPAQETSTTMPSYPDWSSSMQAYYGAGATPPFFASTVASPAPHPYMWGGQTASTTNGVVTEGKNSDAKDQASAKKSKGNSDTGSEKPAENGKAASGSGNDGASQSADSGSEGSSESDENNQQELSANKKGSFDQMLVDGANAQGNAVNLSTHALVPGQPVHPIPATNLNIGMDLWNSSPAGAVKSRPSTGVSSAVPAMVGREGVMSDHQWIQDERELKRQKRKQSNRESARRSRLRKQAECEELQRRVESLSSENSTLREELERLAAECEKLTSENDSIKEELTRTGGPDVISGLRETNPSGDGNS